MVITNQSGIGRGYFVEEQVDRIHQRMCELLAVRGVQLKGIYVCPHTQEEGCRCRKPTPGLVEQAAKEQGFDPKACFTVGDSACDVELGKRIGATTFLVRTGHGVQVEREGTVGPDYVVDTLWEAVPIIEYLVGVQWKQVRI